MSNTSKTVILMSTVFAIGVAGLLLIMLTGCTENQRARQFGGTAKVALPAGQKLVNATWKQDSLWYLTRPMHANETAETYTFQESSSFGMVEGTVIFTESK